ncbi:MAG: Elongation factor 1-beta [Methanonatronarchaeales archaeon]|nr:Elongation factor 1-beta [Methanonatronarchaeales archaeon]
MGDVQVRLRVMPEDVSGTEELGERVGGGMPEGARLVSIDEEPVAFGLKALLVDVVVRDAEGGSEAVEEEVSGLENVQSVQVVDLSRLM